MIEVIESLCNIIEEQNKIIKKQALIISEQADIDAELKRILQAEADNVSLSYESIVNK